MGSRKPCLFWTFTQLLWLVQQTQGQASDKVCGESGVTRTIDDATDAVKIASCTVFTGSIAVGTGFAGVLDLDGIEEVLEDLTVKSTGSITSLGGQNLRRINGDFDMFNATLLRSLDFPVLTSLGGISLTALPSISSFDFTAGISSATNVTISNTFLTTLEGINLKNADIVDINNNLRLVTITLPLETVKNQLFIVNNSPRAELEFGQLTTAGTITLQNMSSISFPALSFLSGNLSLIGTSVDVVRFNKLSVVTEHLLISANSQLEGVFLPELLSAETIRVKNNSKLAILEFEKFGRAKDVQLEGNFTSINMFELSSIEDSFTISTSDPSYDCAAFDKIQEKDVIKGVYSCQGKYRRGSGLPTGLPTLSKSASRASSTSSSSPGATVGKTLSGGAIAGIVIGAIAGLAVLAAATFFLLKRRRSNNSLHGSETPFGTDGKAELDTSEKARTELPAQGQGEVFEAPSQHGVSEAVGKQPQETFELPGEPIEVRAEGVKGSIIKEKASEISGKESP